MTDGRPIGHEGGASPARPAYSHSVTFRDAFQVWLRVALLSFGGPAGQIAVMQRILVDEKRWISQNRFLHALSYCMLLPGPEAQQLATYIGWLLHRTAGGLMAGTLFVLPGVVAILALSIVYARYGQLPIVQAIFFGVKAAVLAIVIEALLKISRRALKNSYMYVLAAAAFVGIFFFNIPFPAIVLAAGLIGFAGGRLNPDKFVVIKGPEANSTKGVPVVDALLDQEQPEHTRPSAKRAIKVAVVCLTLWFGPVVALGSVYGFDNVFTDIGVFFSKMAVVTFGGAYAVLAYVAQEAVNSYAWLSPGEMLDGLGMAETTPGPLIMVLQFVGFMGAYRNPGALDPMLAGTIGALLTTWVTFVPCFLWIFLGAPYIEALRGNKALSAALSAITAAVVGVVLNLAVWFALHVVFGEVNETHLFALRLFVPVWSSLKLAALALAAGSLVAMLRFKVGMMPTLGASTVFGAVYFLAS